jgi:hypothetical protein
MTVRYYIAVEDQSGLVIDLIQNPLSFDYSLGFSKRNVLQLRLSGYDAVNLPPDAMLRLWRKDLIVGGDWRNVGNFIFKTSSRSLVENGLKSTMVWGASPEELVAKAIIAYPSGAVQTRKSGDVAQVLAEFVRENSGADALVANGRYIDHNTGLIVPTPSAVGLSWSGSRSNRPLMDVCQDIVRYSRLRGMRLDFRVDYNSGGYSFAVGILGTDRTITSVNPATGLNSAGNYPVLISPRIENMRSFNDVLARMNESNVVFALGKGQQNDRAIAIAIDNTSRGLSPLAQRESVTNATNELASGLADAAEAILEERVAKRNFAIEPDPTQIKLFIDFNVGDFVTVESQEGERFNRQIVGAKIVVNEGQGRTIEQYSLEFDDI